jgi:hypothetical protein
MTVHISIYPFYYMCVRVSFLTYGSPFFFYFVGISESINHLCRVFLFRFFIFHTAVTWTV